MAGPQGHRHRHGAEDFAIHLGDIPAQPVPGERGKDLPAQVMRQLCQQLHLLPGPEIRTAVELAIDTGRRPEEIATLAWDCLARDDDGAPVAQDQPPAGHGDSQAATRESLRADLAAAHERTTRQAARISQLERKLSDLLGQQAWRESGLGAPADIDALNQKITHLEQHVTDLSLQLEQKDQHLQAARAANRELITQLNATIPAPRR